MSNDRATSFTEYRVLAMPETPSLPPRPSEGDRALHATTLGALLGVVLALLARRRRS